MAIEDPASVMKVNLGEHREACPLHSFCGQHATPLDSETNSIIGLEGLQGVQDTRQVKLTILNPDAVRIAQQVIHSIGTKTATNQRTKEAEVCRQVTIGRIEHSLHCGVKIIPSTLHRSSDLRILEQGTGHLLMPSLRQQLLGDMRKRSVPKVVE